MNLLRLHAALWRARFVFLALAFFATLVAILSALNSLSPPRTPVLVLAHAVPAGHTLTASDLELRSLPRDFLPENTLTAREQAEGKVTTAAYPAGLPLSPPLFLSSEFLSAAAAGHVILSVDVPAHGSESLLTPGTRVAVFAPGHEGSEEAQLLVPLAYVVGIGEAGRGGIMRAEESAPLYLAVPLKEAAAVVNQREGGRMRVLAYTGDHVQ